MKINNIEKKLMRRRLKQLRNYMACSLRTNKIDDYLNLANSRELRLLENVLINNNELTQPISV